MGIQAWFIIFGVGAMMLIVWDGKRCKRQKSTSSANSTLGASGHSPALSIVNASPMPGEPLEGNTPLKAVTTIGARPVVERSVGGTSIGAATHISGKVIADEPVSIKGRLTGTVIAPNHTVLVTATGRVSNYMEGHCVDIDGHLVGTLKANNNAIVRTRARIQGVIEAPRLACMPGAWLQVDVAHQAKSHRPKVALVS
nr:polymer-forming cytoskeletal protein [uncultured Halomonas sp.]